MRQSSIIIAFSAVFLASVAQIILKKTAINHSKEGLISKFLNIGIVTAYSMTLGSSLLNTYALRSMPLKMTTVSEASGYFWVPVLSFLLLDEKLGKFKLFGGIIILIGMVIFSFG
ncbi:MAG: multidrug ABC transporter [Butyrivibrio sp.]|nr:multidrug ABC transporter [Butyrivibrio sp.]